MAAFLQRYLGKERVEDVSWDDFRQFLAQRLPEHQTLEYKSGEIMVTADGKLRQPAKRHEVYGVLDVARAVAGLANAEGGLLVLGVRENTEKHRGVVARILPGAVRGVPAHITRETIENLLRAAIQYPVEGITICPLRPSNRHRSFVYLIDVPQSLRPPHRVNEMYYFQRHNFSTDEMQHYQIADLYGRRLGPRLELNDTPPEAVPSAAGQFDVQIVVRNTGNVIAKYVTAILVLLNQTHEIVNIPQGTWVRRADGNSAQLTLGNNEVVYPDLPLDTGKLRLQQRATTAPGAALLMVVSLYAEGTPAQRVLVSYTADQLPQPPALAAPETATAS